VLRGFSIDRSEPARHSPEFAILMGLISMTIKDILEKQADRLGSTVHHMAEYDKNRKRPEAESIIDTDDLTKVRTILKGTGPYPKHDLSPDPLAAIRERLERFQANWIRVRVKKSDKTKI
jgi:hypothetical protein